MTDALFFGDSITDDAYGTYASGYYAAMVCAATGWRRVGQTPGAANRAAIAGTCLAVAGYNDDLRAACGNLTFAARVAAYAPDVLVLNYGANDYRLVPGGAVTLPGWAAALEVFFEQVQSLPKRPQVYACGLLATWPDVATRTRMDGLTMDAAAAHGAVWVPLGGIRSDQVRADLHPNGRGHGYIAGELLAATGAP